MASGTEVLHISSSCAHLPFHRQQLQGVFEQLSGEGNGDLSSSAALFWMSERDVIGAWAVSKAGPYATAIFGKGAAGTVSSYLSVEQVREAFIDAIPAYAVVTPLEQHGETVVILSGFRYFQVCRG